MTQRLLRLSTHVLPMHKAIHRAWTNVLYYYQCKENNNTSLQVTTVSVRVSALFCFCGRIFRTLCQMKVNFFPQNIVAYHFRDTFAKPFTHVNSAFPSTAFSTSTQHHQINKFNYFNVDVIDNATPPRLFSRSLPCLSSVAFYLRTVVPVPDNIKVKKNANKQWRATFCVTF